MAADIETIIERISSYWPSVDRQMLQGAYEFARQAHEGQQRLTGDPYITHPLAVADILVMLQADPATVAGGLLHDTIEDTTTELAQLTQQFGPQIGQLVEGVTKLRRMDFSSHREEQARNLRKMFLAMADDIRVILIKLADRLHNMRTLAPLPAENQHAIATETLHIFAPLAHRLGIWRLKWELEDLALKHLEPEQYWQIVEDLGQTREQRESQLEAARRRLEQQLDDAGIAARVEGRAKHIYSMHTKMRQQHIDFSQIADLMALRVITDSVSDCYGALGLVHWLWMPLPGMFTDYIAKPKSNQYQSLHTKVIGPNNQPLEVQIRTEQMHERAEYGLAAHWRYKEDDVDPELDQQVSWLRQLLELETDLKESHEFLELLQLDLFRDQVFVFTPDGDVINLPRGAGPVDFAYHIHTEVGQHCARAKVNGEVVPLDYEFHNGDICEIITSPSTQPSRDWLRFIQSSRAKAKIRKFLRDQTQQQNIEVGRRELEEAVKKLPVPQRQLLPREQLPAVAQHLNYADVDSLLAAVGYGEIEVETILSHLRGDANYRPRSLTEEVQLHLPEVPAAPAVKEGLLVTAEGVRDVHSRLSKCCNPLPGDDITGYITRGSGMTVHRSECKNLQYHASREPDRIVPLQWATGPQQPVFRSNIEIIASDRVGLLSHITAIVSDCDINIAAAQTDATSGEFARLHLTLDIHHRRDLERLTDRLEKLIDVVSVRQVSEE